MGEVFGNLTRLAVVLQDQLRRYNEIRNADLPSAVTAKKTKEFRCPPHEQVGGLLY